eukprot:s1330_g13.t1
MRMLSQHRQWLLRQAFGMIPHAVSGPMLLHDPEENTQIEVVLKDSTKVQELLLAEHRLQGRGLLAQVHDLFGRLPPDYDLTGRTIAGQFAIVSHWKRQVKEPSAEMIPVTVMIKHVDGMTINHTISIQAGTFVFEIFNKIEGMPMNHYAKIEDVDGHQWRLDDRVWRPVTFVDYQFVKNLRGYGIVSEEGHITGKALGDSCFDRLARYMLRHAVLNMPITWMPAGQCTVLVTQCAESGLHHWLVSALRGSLQGFALLGTHWILVELHAVGNALHLTCWDGLDHHHRETIFRFGEFARGI